MTLKKAYLGCTVLGRDKRGGVQRFGRFDVLERVFEMLVEQPDVIFGELLWCSSIIKKEPGGLPKRDVEITQERIT